MRLIIGLHVLACGLSLGFILPGGRIVSGAPNVGDEKEVKNSIGMRFVRVPAGKFAMGSPEAEAHRNDDELQHDVSITKAYYIGRFEVTQGQYAKIMGVNPSYFSAKGGGSQRVKKTDTGFFPVERVSWDDAVEFCRKLSEKEGKAYRLPTEAEWEYACRAGTRTPFHLGKNFNSKLGNINGLEQAAYGEPIPGPFYRATVNVGEHQPNDLGLCDMHGNVQEWCSDWYTDDYYKNSPMDDPIGPKDGKERVIRGGAWPSTAKACRSAARGHLPPDEKSYTSGFRVVMEVK